jgi:hypothetical protein
MHRALGASVAGGSLHRKLWVQAEELEEFNRHIVGKITAVNDCYEIQLLAGAGDN